MAHQIALDTEVTGLLRELADTGASHLFGVSASDLRRGALERAPQLPDTSALLSNLERRLLETRREELGLALYWYGYELRNSNTELANGYHQSVSRDRELNPPDLQALASRSQSLSMDAALAPHEPEAVACLRSCLQGSGSTTAAEVMAVALRVAPSDSMRMCLGADLYTLGQRNTSSRVLHDLLDSRPSALLSSYALEELGWQACAEGRYDDAALDYRSAAFADEERVMPAVFWLFAAVQAGDAELSKVAATRLDDMVGPEHSSIRWFKSGHAADRYRGMWAPTSAAGDCLQALDDVGPAAREVLDVFV